MRELRKSTWILLALVAGCASASTGNRPRQTTLVNPNVITRQQLDQFPSEDAYEIVQRLHPDWLMNTAASSFGGTNASNAVQVFIGESGTWLGGVDVLHNYMATQLAMIYHISAIYTNNPNGAILLIKR